jgi:hypothetical protein
MVDHISLVKTLLVTLLLGYLGMTYILYLQYYTNRKTCNYTLPTLAKIWTIYTVIVLIALITYFQIYL